MTSDTPPRGLVLDHLESPATVTPPADAIHQAAARFAINPQYLKSLLAKLPASAWRDATPAAVVWQTAEQHAERVQRPRAITRAAEEHGLNRRSLYDACRREPERDPDDVARDLVARRTLKTTIEQLAGHHDINPQYLRERARELAESRGVAIEHLPRTDIEQLARHTRSHGG